jgi:phosphoribosylformylglycinamidine cyclo-ligase
MRRTFNMGIGFVVVVAPEDAAAATRALEAQGERVYAIGEIVPGARGVEYV